MGCCPALWAGANSQLRCTSTAGVVLSDGPKRWLVGCEM